AMLDLNAGPEPLWSMQGAYPLVLWRRAGHVAFCLEGTAITAGAAITWLRDGLGVIRTPTESGTLAASVTDAGGVWAIPAFQGLGTPYMDAAARAVVGGLSRATTRAHVVRAMLEGIAWRCREVYDALRADCPFAPPVALRVDGGAACNDLLLQLQADALGLPVERPAVLQAGALGAGYLAGLATGVWATTDELRDVWRRERLFEPAVGADERETRFAAWQRHVAAARGRGDRDRTLLLRRPRSAGDPLLPGRRGERVHGPLRRRVHRSLRAREARRGGGERPRDRGGCGAGGDGGLPARGRGRGPHRRHGDPGRRAVSGLGARADPLLVRGSRAARAPLSGPGVLPGRGLPAAVGRHSRACGRSHAGSARAGARARGASARCLRHEQAR